uniref:Transmembrane 9 superfamily member n=1 Tax=Aegilops tauschii subsp. strangulata TaxID=200361 RepID=A0A453IJ89_AEGTS
YIATFRHHPTQPNPTITSEEGRKKRTPSEPTPPPRPEPDLHPSFLLRLPLLFLLRRKQAGTGRHSDLSAPSSPRAPNPPLVNVAPPEERTSDGIAGRARGLGAPPPARPRRRRRPLRRLRPPLQARRPRPALRQQGRPLPQPQSETYRYFDLPFCSPEKVKEKSEALGEVLNGDRLVDAPYKLDFRTDHDSKAVCPKKLTKEDVAKFRNAVAKDYYFQMYYDDLPLWGFIGKVEKGGKPDPSEWKYYLYRHIIFDILYNNDRVIEINVHTDQSALVDLTEDKEVNVDFLYTVKWKETPTPFEKRMEKYSSSSNMPHHLEVHWFSIINSCVTVLLLTGFLATILMRVLKNDFVKYAHDEEAADDQEESGWKYIHGDVFRFPKNKSLFSAALGTGTQLFALTTFIFLLALVGVFYPYNRGALFTALVVIYALTSGIAGYIATSFYCQLEGTNWVRNLLLTGCLFCGPLFLTFCFLNTVAIAYSATAALPFGTICVIVLIWTLVTFPLLVLGGIAGKNSKSEFQAPCRTTKYPREIPPLPWYRTTVPQMAMAGFLPFSAIYIELYYIFASVWGHRIYTIYSILFIVFIILLIVTAFITVALTYFQLAAEDHEWWWRSFLCGGSTGFFVYGYCLYYYYARSDMSGFMQTSFFFGYMACICYAFFLMLGMVGFRAALFFVRHIYKSIKCE